MARRDLDASDTDLAGQAMAGDGSDEEMPGPGLTVGDDADIADVIEQHRGVPHGEDDYDR
jgi:hypothetical protein